MRRRKTAGVHPDGSAEFQCPDCGAVNRLEVDPRLLRTATPVRSRVRCRCGRSHAVYLERRAAVRKEVALEGMAVIDGERERPVTVRNLSRTGVLFEMEPNGIPELGDRLVVRFNLGDHPVRKEVVVRRFDHDAIGAEFAGTDYDREYDMALALYRPS